MPFWHEKSPPNTLSGLDRQICQNPLIARFLAQAGTFLPSRCSRLTGVAVTSQVLCTSITLNKGYLRTFQFSGNCLEQLLFLQRVSYRILRSLSRCNFSARGISPMTFITGEMRTCGQANAQTPFFTAARLLPVPRRPPHALPSVTQERIFSFRPFI